MVELRTSVPMVRSSDPYFQIVLLLLYVKPSVISRGQLLNDQLPVYSFRDPYRAISSPYEPKRWVPASTSPSYVLDPRSRTFTRWLPPKKLER